MRTTIATVLGLGLSGILYSGPDIGGFQGNPSAELYLRWFQMATFFTFYRTHSSNNVEHRTPQYYSVKPFFPPLRKGATPAPLACLPRQFSKPTQYCRTPWTFGEPYLSIIRQFLQLRYRLLPYFYTLSWEATQKGYPPVRPLFWSATDEPALWSVEDAFFLGDALLVCPIVEEGARSRQVILPKGYWYNFWNDSVLQGCQQVTIEAPLEQIPLLVLAGSILPMVDKKQLILHVYPPVEGKSESLLYSDAGDGYGESRLDRFAMTRSENSLEIAWTEEGKYPFPYRLVSLHIHGIKPQQVWIDDKEVSCTGQIVEFANSEGLTVSHRFHKVCIQG